MNNLQNTFAWLPEHLPGYIYSFLTLCFLCFWHEIFLIAPVYYHFFGQLESASLNYAFSVGVEITQVLL